MGFGKSLEDMNASVSTDTKPGFFRKLMAFVGPAYLVSVGYMDPGNWATDIAGGSKFGYALIWVLVMSNLMALLLQSLSARLGLVRGLDLAQASRTAYNPFVNFFLWLLAEIAIAACDLAEVIGMAIGLQLLFNIPLVWGVSLTVLDTLLLLFLIKLGMRKMEAFILALISIIGIAFLVQMLLAHPSLSGIAAGVIPSLPGNEALYIAIGIIGATVMPHNLYLHSSLVQTRKIDRSAKGIKEALKFNLIDTSVALNIALFVNAAILILAAATFYKSGNYNVSEIQDAHRLLEPLLGTSVAPILFAVALIAAGQSSTLTGTLSGQIIMEGYLNLRIQPWLRRLITRLVAIIPAYFAILYFGDDKTGELLVLSQVVLSMQLGFAIIPLIHFVSDKKNMGEFVIGPLAKIGAWITALIIVSLNVKLVYETIHGWIVDSSDPTWIWVCVVPAAIFFAILLIYITILPIVKSKLSGKSNVIHGNVSSLNITTPKPYSKIAITVDFSVTDSLAVSKAISQGGIDAEYVLVHIVETAGARMMNNEIYDYETLSDKMHLDTYVNELKAKGYQVSYKLGYGSPKTAIPPIVNDSNADLLVMGAHGHKGLKDIILGTTLDAVRHEVNIPVLIVKV